MPTFLSQMLRGVMASTTGLVLITDQNINTVGAGAPAKARYVLLSTGVAQTGLNASANVNITGQWKITGIASDYDVEATLVGDALNAGSSATGTRLNMGTSRTWELETSTVPKQATLTVRLYRAGGTTVFDSAVIDLDVEI